MVEDRHMKLLAVMAANGTRWHTVHDIRDRMSPPPSPKSIATRLVAARNEGLVELQGRASKPSLWRLTAAGVRAANGWSAR